jgi:tetratricopeptide (TPR) repeat protein
MRLVAVTALFTALFAAPQAHAKSGPPVTFDPMAPALSAAAPAIHGMGRQFLIDNDSNRSDLKAAVAEGLRQNPTPLTVPQRAQVQVVWLTKEIAAHPDDAALYNQRCFMRGLTKRDLDIALSDCDHALTLEPGTLTFLDRRALILYLQGAYKDALAGYDGILARDPHDVSALLLRGYTRDRLGDGAGRDADIAAATAANPGVIREFVRLGIIAPPG